MDGYVSSCGDLNACEVAVVRDCDPLRTVLASAFVDATADCMNGLGSPQDCMADAVGLTPSSNLLEDFATQLCLECGDGAGDCEDEVISGEGSSVLARAGRLARVLSRDALEDVADECATGENCADEFQSCAYQVLAREVPSDSATCLLGAVQENYDDECGADQGVSGDDGDDGSADDGNGDDGDGDDSDGDTDGGDDSGDDTGEEDCRDEGCSCQFNEDCAGSLVCLDDVCSAGEQCSDDEWEPNNGEIQAAFLPPITDDDGDMAQVSGELQSPNDEDWFRFEGTDTSFSVVNPYAQVNITALTLCMYAECTDGLELTEVTCPEGTTQQPSPGGRPGCCAQGADGIEMELSCMAGYLGSDDAYIYMSVTGSEPGICQEFTIGYHY